MSKCKYKHEEYCAYIDQYCVEGPCPYEEPMTNADRIRAMTDEELAEFFGKVSAGGYGMCAPGHYDCAGKDSCAPCWLDWLKQEEYT